MIPFFNSVTIDTRLSPEETRAQLKSIVRPPDEPVAERFPFRGEIGNETFWFVPEDSDGSPMVRGVIVATADGSRLASRLRVSLLELGMVILLTVLCGLTSLWAALFAALVTAGGFALEYGRLVHWRELIRARLGELLPPCIPARVYR